MTGKIWVWTVFLYVLLMLPVAALFYYKGAARHPDDEVGALIVAGLIFGLPLTIVAGVTAIWEMTKSYDRVVARYKLWKGGQQ